jgi:hypothetical protein
MPPNPRPPFTTLSRILCILALLVTAAAMYWVMQNDTIEGTKKLLAMGGAHFSDGRHRK